MKKTILFVLMLAVLFVSCQKVELGDSAVGQKVKICFNVEMPEAAVVTKSLLDTPEPLSNLYVAVFDANGYFIEYVKASQLAQDSGDKLLYTYAVELTSTDEPRVLHFIGNSPATEMSFGQERALIAALQTSGDQDAYWQRKVLRSGISSNPEAVKTALGQIELVRNYAKVTVTTQFYESTAPSFVLEGIKVYYSPNKAYVAPYVNNAGSFIMDYNSIDYQDLLTSFAGYVPQDATLISYQSGDEDRFSPVVDEKACAYVYERGNPTMDKTDWKSTPTTIIVKGKYNGSTTSSYYKINLMDLDNNYYALLRNFNFNVNIHSVRNAGYTTIQDALNSAGSGDISRVLGYENVTNISDEASRLFIEKTSQVVINSEASTITLKYRFVPDVANRPTDYNNETWGEPVSVLPSQNTGSNPIALTIGEYTNGEVIKSVTVGDSDDAGGWRTIEIEVAGADAALIKKQTLTITGFGRKSDGTYSGSPVSRAFEIIVRPTLKLTAQCVSSAGTPKVTGTKGESLTVRLGLEDDLPAAIFPLALSVEAAAMTLTPAAGANLPVTSGLSLSGNGKPNYQFVRTVTKEEYDSAPTFTGADGTVYRQIDCRFVTNKAASTSVVYVQNEYFNLASCGFSTGAFVFIDPAVDNTRVGASKTFISFSTMDTTPVNVTLTGAKYNGSASFIYTPSSAGLQSIEVVPDAYGNGISFRLTATGYANAQSPVKYRYVEFQANTVGATFSKAPVLFRESNSAELPLSLGIDYDLSTQVQAISVFLARRVANGSTREWISAPQIASGSVSRNNGLNTYTFDVTNFDLRYEYSYSIGNSNVRTVIYPSSVTSGSAHFVIGPVDGSIILYANATGRINLSRNGSSINTYNPNGGNGSVTAYRYTAEGPSSLTVVNFLSDVQESTPITLFFINEYGNPTDYQGQHLTVQNLATGTALGTINYGW